MMVYNLFSFFQSGSRGEYNNKHNLQKQSSDSSFQDMYWSVQTHTSTHTPAACGFDAWCDAQEGEFWSLCVWVSCFF